jgi:hypothetical protein
MASKTLMVLASVLALGLSTAARAAVHPSHALNKMKGEYRFNPDGDYSDAPIEFTIGDKGTIRVTRWNADTYAIDDKDAPQAKLAPLNLSSDIGPEGLLVASILLQSGSDEQTYTYHVRLSVNEIEENKIELVLVDVLFTENDGPNHATSLHKIGGALLKKNPATGAYKPISKLK